MTELPPAGYRPNVGLVVFNSEGRVWLGRRAGARGAHVWQFPQGGIDEGEELEAAARRELVEETGITSVELLGRTPGWIAYDFPPELVRAKGWIGQAQVWFAFRFTGEDAEVDLAAYPPIEFDAWRWAELSEAADLIVPFKRATYARVIAAFAPHAKA
jgi:putative (di)nucleoside polyphosphate hydrolase